MRPVIKLELQVDWIVNNTHPVEAFFPRVKLRLAEELYRRLRLSSDQDMYIVDDIVTVRSRALGSFIRSTKSIYINSPFFNGFRQPTGRPIIQAAGCFR